MIQVALRNPYDLADTPEQVWALAAYEYTPQSLDAVCRVLAGRLRPAGVLPVKLK